MCVSIREHWPMPAFPIGNTLYTRPVAKVMISIPDDLLERLDAQARAAQETRSGFLRRLVERDLSEQGDIRRRQLEDLLGPPLHLGGEAAKLIREDRESH
ncbi:MAG: putative transcriptional regulator, CopG family [Solirubrobacterales bacterium]|nr:putative transcriptional regulator, CopG family [Solirubrobacterales bacterium]